MMARPPVGELLRDWRTRRRRSQMDLALDVGVSTRHLSFVETGRSRPSAELLLAVAHHLEVPLRERNGLLLAAGYAPRFSQMTLDDPAMDHVRASIQRIPPSVRTIRRSCAKSLRSRIARPNLGSNDPRSTG